MTVLFYVEQLRLDNDALVAQVELEGARNKLLAALPEVSYISDQCFKT